MLDAPSVVLLDDITTEDVLDMRDLASVVRAIADEGHVSDRVDEEDAAIVQAVRDFASDLSWAQRGSSVAPQTCTLSELADLLDDMGSMVSYIVGESYFHEWAMDYASETGGIDRESWLWSYVNWDAAADALAGDFTLVDLGPRSYYVR